LNIDSQRRKTDLHLDRTNYQNKSSVDSFGLTSCIQYRQPAPDPEGSPTGMQSAISNSLPINLVLNS